MRNQYQFGPLPMQQQKMASAPPAETAPASTEEAAPNLGLSQDEFYDIFDLDASGSEPKSEGDGVEAQLSGTPSTAAGADGGEAAPAVAPPSSAEAPPVPSSSQESKQPAQPTAQPGTPAADPITPEMRLASLQAEVERLKGLTEAKPAEGGAQPPAQPEQAPAAETLPVVQYQLPDPAKAILEEGDPAKVGQLLESLVSGVATYAQNIALKFAKEQAALAVQGYEQAQRGTSEQQTVAQAAQKLKTDYYAAFPAHNNAVYTSVLNAEAQKLALELPGHPWDQNFVNALGARVNATLAAAGIKLDQGSTTPAPRTPPSMLPAGTRSAAPSPSDSLADEVLDILGD